MSLALLEKPAVIRAISCSPASSNQQLYSHLDQRLTIHSETKVLARQDPHHSSSSGPPAKRETSSRRKFGVFQRDWFRNQYVPNDRPKNDRHTTEQVAGV